MEIHNYETLYRGLRVICNDLEAEMCALKEQLEDTKKEIRKWKATTKQMDSEHAETVEKLSKSQAEVARLYKVANEQYCDMSEHYSELKAECDLMRQHLKIPDGQKLNPDYVNANVRSPGDL